VERELVVEGGEWLPLNPQMLAKLRGDPAQVEGQKDKETGG
jgi:hypothetical protein